MNIFLRKDVHTTILVRKNSSTNSWLPTKTSKTIL